MKHDFKIFKLHFTTPLHLSNEREDYAESLQTLHSDTLYAGLIASLAKIGYQFNDNFNGDLGFSISSLFPFYQEKKETKAVYFFPKTRKIEVLPEALLDIHKKVKKIKWLDKEFFEKQAMGKITEQEYKDSKSFKGSFLSRVQIPDIFIETQVFPHAQVPRQQLIDGEAQDTKLYYMERLFFKDFSGFYFIAEGETALLKKALEILKHEGIGTDRNVGNGYFEVTEDTIQLELPENSEYVMNLSLFLPEAKEQLKNMLDEKTAYSFKKRGGWVTTSPHNTIRKNRVYMFEEGSIFKQKISKPEIFGRIADLTPEKAIDLGLNHRIYRNGKSLFIPIVLNKKI